MPDEPSSRPDTSFSDLLKELRKPHRVGLARESYTCSLPGYTIFEQATGGCLGTISAGITGFRHLGGTEDTDTVLGATKAKMFTDVTNARCFGSARNWKAWVHLITEQVHYYKAGMPCPDYAALGKRMGYRGKKGGDLFVDQIDLIDHLKPYVVCLEMVPTALKVNQGWEIKTVLESLSKEYKVTSEVIQCWRYGDVSTRERIMIIGLRKDIFTDVDWEYPDHVFSEDMYPVARDIAVPDSEVPEEYWRTTTVHQYPKTKPRPGKLHHVGYAGDPDLPKVAGHSQCPYNIQGWDGNLATQMGTNGGSQRPALLNPDGTEWMPGDPISRTRLTVPTETLKVYVVPEVHKVFTRSRGFV